MDNRTFENPLIKDKVRILESTSETNGEYLLLEIELAPGGGNNLHYHLNFDEEFTAIEGSLGIEKKHGKIILREGESATAYKQELHRFFNPGKEPITFQVRLTPGHMGFENGLRIAYGLARDGKTNRNGIPKKIDHLAVILDMTDTRLTGLISVIEPWLLKRAKKALDKGIQRELLTAYC